MTDNQEDYGTSVAGKGIPVLGVSPTPTYHPMVSVFPDCQVQHGRDKTPPRFVPCCLLLEFGQLPNGKLYTLPYSNTLNNRKRCWHITSFAPARGPNIRYPRGALSVRQMCLNMVSYAPSSATTCWARFPTPSVSTKLWIIPTEFLLTLEF